MIINTCWTVSYLRKIYIFEIYNVIAFLILFISQWKSKVINIILSLIMNQKIFLILYKKTHSDLFSQISEMITMILHLLLKYYLSCRKKPELWNNSDGIGIEILILLNYLKFSKSWYCFEFVNCILPIYINILDKSWFIRLIKSCLICSFSTFHM